MVAVEGKVYGKMPPGAQWVARPTSHEHEAGYPWCWVSRACLAPCPGFLQVTGEHALRLIILRMVLWGRSPFYALPMFSCEIYAPPLSCLSHSGSVP